MAGPESTNLGVIWPMSLVQYFMILLMYSNIFHQPIEGVRESLEERQNACSCSRIERHGALHWDAVLLLSRCGFL